MTIPLSLYIHIPWCIKKCPYCDFNSHALNGVIPEKAYIDQLLKDLQAQQSLVQNRVIDSIFIGGGTPSLFSPEGYATLFSALKNNLNFSNNIEITLEANPGTTEASQFQGYFDAGINRISLGVQSFQDDKLKLLGRIHESDHAKNALSQAKNAGFKRINVDLMFGLPNQTTKDALFDLQTAIDLSPTHISWYQLTLEPNTYFHRFPPILPSDDARFEIQQKGQALLHKNGFLQYEISAYSKNDPCRHNMNYWQFGDYLGIGAGAHAKLTDLKTMQINRRMPPKNPKQYLAADLHAVEIQAITRDQLPLEFMMNALRLNQPIGIDLFEIRTGLPFSLIENPLKKAIKNNLLQVENNHFLVTDHGKLFLNELLEIFL
ncbi:MAG: radical SAM family heme chaperone HemW [Coxiellaceae bacterium]|nr:radical SAM family heme chaperone HemW [Coxiellaceae bacterium]